MNYVQWAADLRAEAADDLAAGVIVEIIETWEERSRRSKAVDLPHLARLKCAVRLASSVLDEIVRLEPLAMEGWRYLLPSYNHAQKLYTDLYGLALDLGLAVAVIEQQFPDLSPYFQAEREQFQAQCANSGAETIFEIARAQNRLQ